MKRPLAYITAAWLSGDSENAEQAARYCRAVYEAGFSPICPPLYLPLFLNDAVPEEHKFETKKYWLEKSKLYGKQAILRWLQKENIDTTPNSWQERYHL